MTNAINPGVPSKAETDAAAQAAAANLTPEILDQNISSTDYYSDNATTFDPNKVNNSNLLVLNPNLVNPDATSQNISSQFTQPSNESFGGGLTLGGSEDIVASRPTPAPATLADYRVLTLPTNRGPFSGDTRANAAPFPGDSPNAADNAKNGHSYRISAEGVNPKGTPIIFVNGVNTDLATAKQSAAELSRITGRPVDLTYNGSDPKTGGQATVDHFRREGEAEYERATPGFVRVFDQDYISHRNQAGIANAINAASSEKGPDWAKKNILENPPAATAAANNILNQLNATEGSQAPVRVVGYSQGGSITAEALRQVNTHLTNTVGADKAKQMMSRVNVMTLGGASNRQDYANANVTNFRAITHDTDIISQYLGENRAALGQGQNGANIVTNFNRMTSAFSLGQHTNYLPGMAGGRSQGDPAIDGVIRDWMKPGGGQGQSLTVLPDFNAR
jgi:hypothetical protein